MPALSPDGNFVVYRDEVKHKTDWFVIAVRGTGKPRRLSYGNYGNGRAEWSPDSRTVAFTTDPDDSDAYLVEIAAPHPRLLAKNVTKIAWSPDGRQLAAVVGYDKLVLLNRRGAVKRVLHETVGTHSIFDLSWAPAQTIAYIENQGNQMQNKCRD